VADTTDEGIDRLRRVIAERVARVAELEAELGKHDPLGLDDHQALSELAELEASEDEDHDDEEEEPEQNPRALRAQFKQVGHRMRDLEARLASATAAPVADQLTAKGYNPGLAKFYTAEDASEDAVGKWIEENADLFTAAPEVTPAEEPYVLSANERAAMAVASLGDLGTGLPAAPYKPRPRRPKTIEAFDKLVRDLPDGEDGYKAMEELNLIAKPKPVITPNYPLQP
jgi:hypothetical protein